MTSEIALEVHCLAKALADAGKDDSLRNKMFEALRCAENSSETPTTFKESVRWPIILAMLSEKKTHIITLANGLKFDVSPDSRIEKAFLLSSVAHPDHVWEPQTTKLLTQLARTANNIIVGGAYIGDHVLPMAHAMFAASRGLIHAFEPMSAVFARLSRNLELNSIENVIANRLCLWDKTGEVLALDGPPALASTSAVSIGDSAPENSASSITIDEYVRTKHLASVELIMLDTEGSEEKALKGAAGLLSLEQLRAPNIVFEIHRNFVDWSAGLPQTSPILMLTERGYTVFAIRDFHDNVPTTNCPIEIVPLDRIYLEGPPHGFNLLATKDSGLIQRLGLQIVENVSPKLIMEKDPRYHHPLTSLSNSLSKPISQTYKL